MSNQTVGAAGVGARGYAWARATLGAWEPPRRPPAARRIAKVGELTRRIVGGSPAAAVTGALRTVKGVKVIVEG